MMTIYRILALACLVCGLSRTAFAEDVASLPDAYHAIVSDLQAMATQYHPEEDWKAMDNRLAAFIAEAKSLGENNWVVEALVIRARTESDMRKNYPEAIKILNDTLNRYGSREGVPAIKKVYVTLASVYARSGDEGAVSRTIAAFRSSPHYDPEVYAFSGATRRGDSLRVARPTASASESVSVTAMEVYQTQARFTSGQPFPDFSLEDDGGKVRTLESYRGRLLLVDFWLSQWTPWLREVSSLKGTYERHHDEGFEILGVSLAADKEDARSFAANQGLAWPQVFSDQSLGKELGVFGEAMNFLVDGDGVILARNIRGADLEEAVRQALGD